MTTDCNSAPVVHEPEIMTLPDDYRCLKCDQFLLKNQQIPVIREEIGGESSKFRIKLYRFYFQCTHCSNHIILRTSFVTHSFMIEFGARELEQYIVHPNDRRKIGVPPENIPSLEKYLEKFPDTLPSMMIVRALDLTLDYIKRSESCGNVSEQEIYILSAKHIQDGHYPNKCPHFVIRNDDKIVMSPFVKLLTKVTWNHLPNFLKELRDFVSTDKFIGIVFAHGEPNKRGKDKVEVPTGMRPQESSEPFLEEVDKISMRDAKAPVASSLVHHPSVLVPFHMKCKQCSNSIRKGERYPMLEETFGEDSIIIRMRLFRYYLECPKCSSSMVFRTDFRHTKYIKEYGIASFTPKGNNEKLEVKKGEGPSEPLDPMSMLSQFPKCPEGKKKVIDNLENALYEFRSEMEHSIVDVWAPKVETEREEEKDEKLTVPPTLIEKRSIRPFSETMNMVPEHYCKRFYVSLLHQTATEQFVAKTTPYFAPFTEVSTSEAFISVLNEWWKKKHFSNILAPKLTMVPFGMKCKKCSNCIYKGKKLEMAQEIIGDGCPLLRTKLYRFYMNCPHCQSPMVFRSHLLQNRYIKEFGIELLPEGCKKVDKERIQERYCNPMKLLKKERKLNDHETKLVEDIEDNIAQIGKSEDTAKLRMLTMIRCEIDKQLVTKYEVLPQRIRDWETNPFSDTVQLVPEYHTSRFIQVIMNQLATPEFRAVAQKKPRHYVRDTYHRHIEECKGLQSLITPASSKILPIHLKCKKCSKMIYVGTKLDMKLEQLQGLLCIPIKIYRYYFKCPHCSSQIIIRSELSDQEYRAEYGAEKIQKPKEKWHQEIPKGIEDPRKDIKRFVRDERTFLDILGNFETSVNKLMFEGEYSPEMQMMMARVVAEKIPGYIGTKNKNSTYEAMTQLFQKHCPYGLSVKNIPDNGIFHAMLAFRRQLMTDEFKNTVFSE